MTPQWQMKHQFVQQLISVNESVLLYGKRGSGKSVFLRQCCKKSPIIITGSYKFKEIEGTLVVIDDLHMHAHSTKDIL